MRKSLFIFKNTSTKEIVRYMAAINGQTIFGLNLKSGQSSEYRIAVDGDNLFRFTLYTSLDPDERYSIEPMDYTSQVSKLKLVKGTYLYTVNIDRHDQLNISLHHLKN